MIMAVLPTKIFTQPDDEWFKSITTIPTYNSNSVMTKDYAIKGEMLTVQKPYSDLDYFELENKCGIKTPDVIKSQLLNLLVNELYNKNFISFVMIQDPTTLNRCFRARIFVTPDSQTRIVKELLDKKN